jgi:hypothetical protein
MADFQTSEVDVISAQVSLAEQWVVWQHLLGYRGNHCVERVSLVVEQQ